MKDQRCSTLALAGVFQAASLVNQIANTGKANNANIETSIESLFIFDAENADRIYGTASGVQHGLKTLVRHMKAEIKKEDVQIMGYVVSLLVLERKLNRAPSMMKKLHDQLQTIESQFEFFNLQHTNTFAKLAQLYKDTVSTLGPKIMVSGEYPHLNNENNANKVRALLLAGIRSAVLWRQCGGSRWQLLFGRKKIAHHAEQILTEM